MPELCACCTHSLNVKRQIPHACVHALYACTVVITNRLPIRREAIVRDIRCDAQAASFVLGSTKMECFLHVCVRVCVCVLALCAGDSKIAGRQVGMGTMGQPGPPTAECARRRQRL
jgi:hypothetical protein